MRSLGMTAFFNSLKERISTRLPKLGVTMPALSVMLLPFPAGCTPQSAGSAAAITSPSLSAPTFSAKQRTQLIAFLAAAPEEGLAAISGLSSLDDRVLIEVVLAKARALHAGQLTVQNFRRDWALRPAAYDPRSDFFDAIRRDRLDKWFTGLRPPYSGYDALRAGLSKYRRIAAAGGWSYLGATDSLPLGAAGPTVSALRRRLFVEDHAVQPQGSTFDTGLQEAVKRAQRRYGLEPNGMLNARTAAALNVPVENRIRQIRANMERWRWMPSTLPERRIQVNIAAAVLTLFDSDKPVLSMRAVTGRPGAETPMLQSTIQSILVNPPWNVPQSITTRELLPKERAHPGYLARNGFKLIPLAEGGSRLQQEAGARSALGRLKFDFDNTFSVYLHDTPTQTTFARYDRLESHGCVRLEHPVDLAEALLAETPGWDRKAVLQAIALGTTKRVRLTSGVAVFLLYWTAFASADGQMNFRADPYGWDTATAPPESLADLGPIQPTAEH